MVREAVKMAVLLMWYLTVRGSDVCCQRQTYDPPSQYTLLISDIEESPCGSFYMVTIPRSKSDPLNLGGVGFVVATGGPMCPVSAIRVYLQSLRSAGLSASAPFLTCANGHFVVMSDIASAIKASAVALGQDPSLYSTQSVRAGSTNAMRCVPQMWRCRTLCCMESGPRPCVCVIFDTRWPESTGCRQHWTWHWSTDEQAVTCETWYPPLAWVGSTAETWCDATYGVGVNGAPVEEWRRREGLALAMYYLTTTTIIIAATGSEQGTAPTICGHVSAAACT